MAETVQETIRFLVPVDYSVVSRQAALYALHLAEHLKASVHFLHVYYSPAMDAMEISASNFSQAQLQTDVMAEMEKSEKEMMAKFVKDVTSEALVPAIHVSQFVLPGIPEDEITGYAQENNYDLVVMGTRGKNAQKVAIFGSVTISVMDRAKVPLLMIPENYIPIHIRELNNLLYVTSFEKADPESLDRLMRLLAPVKNVRIIFGHLQTEPSDDWDDIKLNGLCDRVRTRYQRPEVEVCRFTEKNLIKDLDEYITQNKINVIAMTSRRRSLISKLFAGDVTRKILYHSTIPLLVFRP